jgi:hypothetical protein
MIASYLAVLKSRQATGVMVQKHLTGSLMDEFIETT